MSVIYWGTVSCEDERLGAWLWAKVRPRWYWFLCRVWLFVRLVWRRYDDQWTNRIDWRTAWDVAEVAEGLSEVRARRMKGGKA